MTPSPPTCVSWLLLASYAVLLGVGGVGVWVSVNNFWEDEPLPPTPSPLSPPDLEIDSDAIPTTTPSSHYGHNDNSWNEENLQEMYQEYIYASIFFATAASDSRLYVVVPCAVSVVVAALVLIAGLWTREFFSFTFSLYSSVGMLALTLIWAIIYQDVVAWEHRMNLDSMCWVLSFQAVLMILLSMQILLCVWELRRQEAGWPTINFSNVFTVEALLVAARMTLTVYTFLMMDWSQMFRGYETVKDPRYNYLEETPHKRCPLVFILVCFSAACFNAVATIETMLSVLLGKVHKNMTTVTSLLSALCSITVAILNSPAILKVITKSDELVYPETMYFAIGLSVVLFLHVVASLVFPVGSRSPPGIITKIPGLLVTSLSSIRSTVSERLLTSPILQRKRTSYGTVNLISVIFTSLSIIISAAVWYLPMYYAWGSTIVMCANSATLVRTLPAFVAEFVFKEPENTTVNQRLMAMSLECLALLVGASAMCALNWRGSTIFVGVMNLLFLVFQIFIIAPLLREKIRPQTQSNEAERLAETEVPNEDQDDEQNPIVTLP